MAEANTEGKTPAQLEKEFPFGYKYVSSATYKGAPGGAAQDNARTTVNNLENNSLDKKFGDGNYIKGDSVSTTEKLNDSWSIENKTTWVYSRTELPDVDTFKGKEVDAVILPTGRRTTPDGQQPEQTPETPPQQTAQPDFPTPDPAPINNDTSNNQVNDDSGTGSGTGGQGTNNKTNNTTNDGAQSGEGPSSNANVTEAPNSINPVTNQFTEKLPSTKNPLSQFSSVSYILSLYAITPAASLDFKNTGQWDLSKLILLIQNGGINTAKNPKRSEFFNYDFTIDDLEITTLLNPKETGSASNSVMLKFKIFEPYSMTLTSRLALQQQQIVDSLRNNPKAQEVNALRLPLLLAIKFLGYDAEGQVVSSGNQLEALTKITSQSVDGTYFRAFPIIISKMTFKLENKTTVYDVSSVVENNMIGFGTMRGTLNGPATVYAETVDEAIKQVIKGFNEKQEDLSTGDKKQQDYADKYEYKIIDKVIGDAFIADSKAYNKSRTGMLLVKSSLESNIKNSVGTVGVNQAKRQIEFASGQPILKIFDQIITQSTFIGDALSTVQKEEDPVLDDQDDTTSNPKPKQLYWYNVTPQVYQDTTKWDEKRQQHPVTITYYIKKYKVPYVNAVGIENTPQYPGPTKVYNYFYTGQNTEVLAYEQTYNLAYYTTMSAVAGATLKSPAPGVPSNPAVSTGGSPVGKESDKNSIIAGITNYLESPGDQVKAQITILGDPDYLMPSICHPLTKNAGIDPSLGQVFVEIEFKAVEDYGFKGSGQYIIDNDDGLMTPNDNIRFWKYDETIKNVKPNIMVYMLVGVISKFSKGVFSQLLKTVLPSLVMLNKTTASSSAAEPSQGRGDLRDTAPRITQTPAPTVKIGATEFAVLKPELNPAGRPLMNVPRDSEGRQVPGILPPNLRPGNLQE